MNLERYDTQKGIIYRMVCTPMAGKPWVKEVYEKAFFVGDLGTSWELPKENIFQKAIKFFKSLKRI